MSTKLHLFAQWIPKEQFHSDGSATSIFDKPAGPDSKGYTLSADPADVNVNKAVISSKHLPFHSLKSMTKKTTSSIPTTVAEGCSPSCLLSLNLFWCDTRLLGLYSMEGARPAAAYTTHAYATHIGHAIKSKPVRGVCAGRGRRDARHATHGCLICGDHPCFEIFTLTSLSFCFAYPGSFVYAAEMSPAVIYRLRRALSPGGDALAFTARGRAGGHSLRRAITAHALWTPYAIYERTHSMIYPGPRDNGRRKPAYNDLKPFSAILLCRATSRI
ncbi:hypothetical protein EVAR_78356_1 [Eumeta japonica]|uniref:Uncharacterized protein n=1 Tax=Eumeta variegata TaxID=151549 RepID=A0A4C1T3B3_EUMVA|nr:hypothetical protein EVAR_78356_1 [Eumeta japonica]